MTSYENLSKSQLVSLLNEIQRISGSAWEDSIRHSKKYECDSAAKFASQSGYLGGAVESINNIIKIYTKS
jgi:hypothetical protein